MQLHSLTDEIPAERPKGILEILIDAKMITGRMIEAHRDLHSSRRALEAIKNKREVYFSAASEPVRKKIADRNEELFSLYRQLQEANDSIRAWVEQEYAA